jgi:hypothetical protein
MPKPHQVGDTIQPPADTIYKIIKIGQDNLLLEWEMDGNTYRCWCPKDEFEKLN